jgi:hypothetical protein
MKIAKYLNHFGVDKMLKAVLGDSLEIFRDDNLLWTAEQVGVKYTLSDVRDDDWDLFIYDDHYSVVKFQNSGCKAKHYIWYCHGTFTEWKEPQEVFNARLGEVSVIYTDDFKRSLTETWREFAISDTITLPIALGPEYYLPLKPKSGRIALVGNSYAEVCSHYPRWDNFAKPSIEWLVSNHSDILDVYGYNDSDLGVKMFGEHRRGPGKISELGSLSASIQLSATASIGFVLAESFAAGIPVISTAKYQLPNDGWKCVYTLDQLKKELQMVLNDSDYADELGKAGRTMYQTNFSLDSYRDKLVPWLEKQY